MKFIKIAHSKEYLDIKNVPTQYHDAILEKFKEIPKRLKKKFIDDAIVITKSEGTEESHIQRIKELNYKEIKSFIQSIEDPYLKLFIRKYNNTFSLNKFESEEQLNEFISEQLIELGNKINPENEDNFYLKEEDINVNQIANDPNMPDEIRERIRNVPKDQIVEKYLEFWNESKQENFVEWWEEVYDNEYYSTAFQYIILESVFKTSDEKTKNPVKAINAEIVANLSELIQENPGKDLNIIDNIKDLEKEIDQRKGNIIGNTESGWIEIESKTNDPENLEENVKRLSSYSCDMGWCIANKLTAKHYLSEGNVYIYLKSGKTLVGLALSGEKTIKEIQGKNNRRPFEYWEEVVNFVDKMGFDKGSKHFKELEELKIINEKVSSDEVFAEEFRQKILSNPSEYDKLTKENKFKFADTISEVADTVSESIKENGAPPNWAYYWAKKKLEEGTESYITDIWIPSINKYIEKHGYPPDWASDWAIKKLEEGTESYVTDIWIPRISKAIKEDEIPPIPPNWAYYWAKKKLEEGTESYVTDIWIPRINKIIEKNGDAPRWAYDWAKDNPEKCIEGISGYIEKYGKAPGFCYAWAIKKLEEGTESYITKIWIPIINKYIEKYGNAPRWAYGWAKNKLEEGTESYVTDIWIPRINKRIEKDDGYLPNWAEVWAKKKLEEGTESYVIKIWIPSINKHIEKHGKAPRWAYDWARNNPEKCIEGINKYIKRNNEFPISFNFFKEEYYRIINQRNIQEPTTETTETTAKNWYLTYKMAKNGKMIRK